MDMYNPPYPGEIIRELLVPKLRLGTNTLKLRFILEAELQEQEFPSWSLGTRTTR